MITQISLKGFQSHVNSQFNLGQGLNVITGPSDAGKTAIIRAVRWVTFNEPQGGAFVNESAGEAEVKLFLSDNSIITKTRRKGKTSYLIQHDETDEGSLFEKSEVPLEVKRLLGIEKHSFGDFESALNFSFQLDAPFLISETASAGAKVLGKLAGTESVDLAIKGVSKDTYAARQLRTQAEKDAERIVGSLFEYEGIDDAKQMLETAEMILEQVEASKDKLDNLKEYKHLNELAREKIEEFSEVLQGLMFLPELEEDLQDIEKAQHRYDLLLQLYSDGSRLLNRLEVLSNELSKYQEIHAANDLLANTEIAAERLSVNILLRQSYQRYTDDVKRTSETLDKVKEIDTAAEDLSAVEKDINRLIDLRSLKFEYLQDSSKLVDLEAKVQSFAELNTAEEYLLSLTSDVEWFAKLTNLHKDFLVCKSQVAESESRVNFIIADLTRAEQEIQQAWDEAGGVCPLCEQPVEEGHTHA